MQFRKAPLFSLSKEDKIGAKCSGQSTVQDRANRSSINIPVSKLTIDVSLTMVLLFFIACKIICSFFLSVHCIDLTFTSIIEY